MAHVRDSDTALWLHNKLGSAEELWIPSSISGIIKVNTIDNIYRCFPVLTTTVKLKLLLGILHLPRRNLEEMRNMIEGIIEVALEDTDLWVKLVANIIRTYPINFNLNLDLRSSQIAQNVIQQLSEKVTDADTFASLPLECQLVNKTSLQSLVGSLPPLNRHFALKRKPKSAALRADLMHKSSEAATQIKKGGLGGGNKSVPVKHRDMTRRSSDIGPMRRIPTKTTISRADSLRAAASQNIPGANRSFSRIPGRQHAGGTKLLDISEQPIGGSGISVRDSKRRKKQLQQQESAVSTQSQEEEPEKPADYTADLVSSLPSQSVIDDDDVEEEVEISTEVEKSASLPPSPNESLDKEQASSDEESHETPQLPEPSENPTFSNTRRVSTSDIMSPHSTSSSRVEIASPQSLSSPPMSLTNTRPISMVPSTTSILPQLGSPSGMSSPGQRQPPVCQSHIIRAQIPTASHVNVQSHPIRYVHAVPQSVGHSSAQHQLQSPIPMYVPNTVIVSSPNQPNTMMRAAPTVLVQQPPQLQHHPHQIHLPNPNFYQPRLPQQFPQQSVISPPRAVYIKPQQVQQQPPPPQPTQPAPKKGLTLTREQMFEAQEMFRTANRLSRPEKAVILGFMAGSRENPYPEQGDIVRIVLSETVQNMQNPNGTGILPVVVETIFEMNYRTGKTSKSQRIKLAHLAVPQPGIKT